MWMGGIQLVEGFNRTKTKQEGILADCLCTQTEALLLSNSADFELNILQDHVSQYLKINLSLSYLYLYISPVSISISNLLLALFLRRTLATDLVKTSMCTYVSLTRRTSKNLKNSQSHRTKLTICNIIHHTFHDPFASAVSRTASYHLVHLNQDLTRATNGMWLIDFLSLSPSLFCSKNILIIMKNFKHTQMQKEQSGKAPTAHAPVSIVIDIWEILFHLYPLPTSIPPLYIILKQVSDFI